MQKSIVWPALAITIFCLMMSVPIFHAMFFQYLNQSNFLPFLVWCIPFVWYGTTTNGPLLLILALILVTLGLIISINTIIYFGFVLALSWWAKFTWGKIIWILCAVSWMPSFAWFLLDFSPFIALIIRLCIAIIGTCAMSLENYYSIRARHD